MNKASGWFPGGSVYNPPVHLSNFCWWGQTSVLGGSNPPNPLANPALYIPQRVRAEPGRQTHFGAIQGPELLISFGLTELQKTQMQHFETFSLNKTYTDSVHG